MRERYRNMMEHETLHSETKASILERMEQADDRKTGRHPLRAALSAACLCLALAGTVFVASAKNDFGQWASVTPKEGGSYAMEIKSSLKLYAMDTFSSMLQEDMATAESTSQTVSVHPESWQEALDYVGIPLAKNTLLDDRELFQIENPISKDQRWRLRVELRPGLVYISRSYEVDGILINVVTGIFTEAFMNGTLQYEGFPFWWYYFEPDGQGGITAAADYDDMFHGVIIVDNARTETTADGTNILFLHTKDETYDWYGASFVYDGISYTVEVTDAETARTWQQTYDPETQTLNPNLDYEGMLRQVIDSFAFEIYPYLAE